LKILKKVGAKVENPKKFPVEILKTKKVPAKSGMSQKFSRDYIPDTPQNTCT